MSPQLRSLEFSKRGASRERIGKCTGQSQVSLGSKCGSEEESWLWASVDVPGSPQLARLFKVLGAEDLSVIELPDLVLPTSIPQEHDPSLVNHSQLQLSSPEGFIRPYSNRYNYANTGTLWPAALWNDQRERSRKEYIPPPDPFSELYPFPVSVQGVKGIRVHSQQHIDIASLHSRIKRLKPYLSTFSTTIPGSNPLIIKSMEELAETYGLTGDTVNAEMWWRRAVASREAYDGPTAPGTVRAMLELFQVTNWQGGRIDELVPLENKLQRLITESLPADDEMALDFLDRRARRLTNKCQWQEAEDMGRRVLQIRLNQLGPKHYKSMQAINRLSRFMSRRMIGDFLDRTKQDTSPNSTELASHPAGFASLHLARAAVQILAESKSAEQDLNEQVRTMETLPYVLRLVGAFEESAKMYQILAQRCHATLGEAHPVTARQYTQLGIVYCKQRQFAKSVDTLQRVIRLQQENNNLSDLYYRSEECAFALQGLGRYEEAWNYLQLTFVAHSVKYGISHRETKDSCYRAGENLMRMGLYGKTLAHYREYLEKVKAVKPMGSGKMQEALSCALEVEDWIREVEHKRRAAEFAT